MTVSARCVAHPGENAETSCARCGDNMCVLCGPLEPLALCARCLLRGTVDWEERGELSLLRAFARTWLESVSGPARLSLRLRGSGHVLSALSYAAIVAALSSVPLAFLFNVLLFGVLAPKVEGFVSMRVLGLGVTVAIGSVVVTSLVPIAILLWSLAVCGLSKWTRTPLRLDTTIRASCYGVSALAIPIAGVPLAFAQELWLVRALLSRDADG